MRNDTGAPTADSMAFADLKAMLVAQAADLWIDLDQRFDIVGPPDRIHACWCNNLQLRRDQ